MRAKCCKKLVCQLFGRSIQHAATNLPQLAAHRSLDGVGQPGKSAAISFKKLDLRAPGSHTGSAARAFKGHDATLRHHNFRLRDPA